MDAILNTLIGFFGPFGSPWWWIIGAAAVSVFLARWAHAIRTLLPFIGAGTILAIILWTLVNLKIIIINI